MPDLVEQPTLREQFGSDGSLADRTFDAWCSRLRELGTAEPLRYGPDPIEACGPECWRNYYDDGYTPESAWAEDGAYV